MIRITVTDTATGNTETAEIWDDYALITAGSCHQVSVGYDPNDPETQHITVHAGGRPVNRDEIPPDPWLTDRTMLLAADAFEVDGHPDVAAKFRRTAVQRLADRKEITRA